MNSFFEQKEKLDKQKRYSLKNERRREGSAKSWTKDGKRNFFENKRGGTPDSRNLREAHGFKKSKKYKKIIDKGRRRRT